MSQREAKVPRIYGTCEESGKRQHSSIHWCREAARETHRDLNARGELAVDFYAYRCPSCRKFHITHHATWMGEPQTLVLKAAPVELQRWAMGQEVADG